MLKIKVFKKYVSNIYGSTLYEELERFIENNQTLEIITMTDVYDIYYRKNCKPDERVHIITLIYKTN
jgi:hypothetical protein